MGKMSQFSMKCLLGLALVVLTTSGCRLVDGQDPGVNALALASLTISASCANESFVAEGYSCQPQLTIAHGVNPNQLTWELTQDHTCSWLQINSSTGQLFGTPGKTNIGSCVASLRVVTDVQDPRTYSLAVNVKGPKISFVANNCSTTVAVDQNYSCDFDATTPLAGANFTWALAADNKCSWASIDSATGIISGKPPLSAVGSCRLSLSVNVDGIASAATAVILTVPQVPVTVSLASCSTALEAGVAYACSPTASAPVSGATFTWSFSAANTCSWAQINSSTGQITGTPAIYSAGNCRLDVTAKIANGSSGQSSATLKIATKGYNEFFLTESAGDANEHAGSSVAMDGNWAVVGTPEDFNGAGSASVFQFDGTVWRKKMTFTSPDPQTIKGLGYSVAISGNSILVGAPSSNTREFNEGAVLAYEFNGTSWVQSQIIVPTQQYSQLMGLGASLDIDGAQAVVATSHYNAEAAYIMQKSGSTWTIGVGLPFDAVASYNGPTRIKVALNAGLAVVSDTAAGPTQTGEVRVYRQSAGTWTLNGVISGAAGIGFGASVDTYNNRILIGAPGDRGIGSAFLYEGGSTSWVIAKTFRAVDETSGLQFGASVSLINGQAVIGAPASEAAGSAYVYKLNTVDWNLDSKLMPSTGQAKDNFGVSVAASGTNIFVGANQYSYNSVSASGGVYNFRAK